MLNVVFRVPEGLLFGWVVRWVGSWVQSYHFAMGWVGSGQWFGGLGWINWTHRQLWARRLKCSFCRGFGASTHWLGGATWVVTDHCHSASVTCSSYVRRSSVVLRLFALDGASERSASQVCGLRIDSFANSDPQQV